MLASFSMNWQLLCTTLGLALILEGLPYFLFPEASLRVLRELEQLGPMSVRLIGLVALFAAVVLLWIGRTLAP